MRFPTPVSARLAKPLLVFDGNCNFCRRSVGRLRQIAGNRIEYLPYQDPQVPARFPEIPPNAFEQSVQFIECDGNVYSGAEAIFRAIQIEKPWWNLFYRDAPGFAEASETVYGFVARHRTFASILSRSLWGDTFERSSYVSVRWVFLRALAVIYLIAFVSLRVQIDGLAGRNGIMPAEEVMQAARSQIATLGLERFHIAPTLCWISASGASLRIQCDAGIALAFFLLLGLAPAVCLLVLWMLYLSVATVCPVFLAFQWDNLLLETGLLAIFWAPLNCWPGRGRETPLSPAVLWLLRWLLFRLMFASGLVKLLSGDPTWQKFDALNFHYETQPLPTWIGWYAHQLPGFLQKACVLLMFGVELVVPFLIFLPRRVRLLAFWPLVALQIAIALTGNYGFFNLLALALCLLLLDDRALHGVLPNRWRAWVETVSSAALCPPSAGRWRRVQTCHGVLVALAAAVVLLVSSAQLFGMFRFRGQWLNPLVKLYVWASPFRSVNGYGLFAVMTTSRPEIVIQGGDDGEQWRDYEFKWKAGDPRKPPGFVEPHMPRLDWQMWFAALGTYRQNPWFIAFCVGLLHGTPEVVALLKENPFPKTPPKYIRALRYDYHFTTLSERRKTGMWWRRESRGEYCPVISLRQE